MSTPPRSTATLVVRRFDRERPHLLEQTEHSVSITPNKTILSALLEIQAEQDSTLVFRASCRHGACGSCTMDINGRPRLACSRLLRDEVNAKGNVFIGPLAGVAVVRDLIVDLSPFWKAYRESKPWLIRYENRAPRREFRVRPDELSAFEGADACVLCAACWSACPVTRAGRFDGPHALLKTHLRVTDPRDESPGERLRGVADDFGAFRCHGVLACASVCPKGIDVSEAVFALRASMTHAKAIGEERRERQPSLLGNAPENTEKEP
ncbi:MAG: 4Fe-4S dicluster domain-containing protein [Polyangiaceae bacterium]|nr:4Fe-4S dicluster domain-containing protein [Polyangiaceae bacterium]